MDTTQTQAKFISKPTIASPPQKKQKMTLSQTYVLAHTARNKLSKEASRPDHDLRLLVGHANLLDSLMLELADAEREQEQWFNQTVKGASKAAAAEPRHIQWADTIVEESEHEWEVESDSDSESEFDEDELDMAAAIAPRTSRITTVNEDEDEYEDDDEEASDLALTRTHSHSPPELLHDSDEDSSEDEQPPSPPAQTLKYSEKERQSIATTSFYQPSNESSDSLSSTEQQNFFNEGYYLPERSTPALVAVC
jgi:hypothetical protein